MEPKLEHPSPFEFSGGALCLDFVNTVGDRPHCDNEKLAGFADLLRWSAEAGILVEDQLGRLAREAARRPRLAHAAFRRAVQLRERLYRIFSKLATGGRPGDEDLDGLNRALAAALRHLRVEPEGDGFGWAWSTPRTHFDHLVWPVARSAAELLTSPETDLVRECASDRCSWMFVDRSRTHRRRWCDMKVCGNRAKARRHYLRKKRSSRR